MSSWANIRVPRKRDISQIPNELRPQIIPRAQRAEVVISESYHTILNNFIEHSNTTNSEFKNNGSNNNKQNGKNTDFAKTRQYISKKIDIIPSPSAVELKYNDKSYVFVILRHLRNAEDNDLWISSYNSIRKFYTNKIVIIDDNSAVNTINGSLYNTEVIQSEFPGAGETLPYYYFFTHKWADKMIFLHDSMFINRPLKNEEIEADIRFHWHFLQNSFDDTRKIKTYINLLKNNSELKDFINNSNSLWLGCFGGTSICDISVVSYLEEKYGLFTTMAMVLKTRKDRETFERILGIVSFFEKIITNQTVSNFGNIMAYPAAFDSNNNYDTAKHIISQNNYNTAILKVWRGR